MKNPVWLTALKNLSLDMIVLLIVVGFLFSLINILLYLFGPSGIFGLMIFVVLSISYAFYYRTEKLSR